TVLGVVVDLPADGEFGAALGAARLGQIATENCEPLDICRPPKIQKSYEPNLTLKGAFDDVYQRYRLAYPAISVLDL
ncbi:MAG: xylulokinase, partial [Hyphomicrobiaceae bacterium]